MANKLRVAILSTSSSKETFVYAASLADLATCMK